MPECLHCGAKNLAGALFCTACALPLGAVGQAAPAPVGRAVRLMPLRHGMPGGSPLALPDTDYAGELLLGRQDLSGGVVVDVDLTALDGLAQGVSRRHARLLYAGGLVRLADGGSAHGTWLNKVRLGAGVEVPLADGDEVRLAGLAFRVEVG